MQAPAVTTAPPNAANTNSAAAASNTVTAKNNACKPLDKIRGLTRSGKDVNEKVSSILRRSWNDWKVHCWLSYANSRKAFALSPSVC